MLLTHTKRTLLVSVTVMLAAVAGVVFFANYVIAQGEALRQQAQVVADEEVQQDVNQRFLEDAEDSLVLREELGEVVLQSDDDVIEFLALIESFNSPAVEVTVDTVEEITLADFPALRFPLSIAGDAEAVTIVLDSLETLPYASYLESLQLSSGSQAESARYQVNVALVVALKR